MAKVNHSGYPEEIRCRTRASIYRIRMQAALSCSSASFPDSHCSHRLLSRLGSYISPRLQGVYCTRIYLRKPPSIWDTVLAERACCRCEPLLWLVMPPYEKAVAYFTRWTVSQPGPGQCFQCLYFSGSCL